MSEHGVAKHGQAKNAEAELRHGGLLQYRLELQERMDVATAETKEIELALMQDFGASSEADKATRDHLEQLDKKLEDLRGASESEVRSERLTIDAIGLELQHDTRYWIHIWACDQVANCMMYAGYPFLVDLTPATKHTLVEACWLYAGHRT